MNKTSPFQLRLVRGLVMSIFVLGAYALPANAEILGEADCTCCAPNDEECKANCQAAENARQVIRNQQIQKYIPTPASVAFSQSSCIDLIMNTRINISFSAMTADAIIQAILDAIRNAACKAVMGAWDQALGKVNAQLGTAVSIPGIGNVVQGGAGVGPSSSASDSVINYQGNGVGALQTYTPGAVQGSVQNATNNLQQFGRSNVDAAKKNVDKAAGTGSRIMDSIRKIYN